MKAAISLVPVSVDTDSSRFLVVEDNETDAMVMEAAIRHGDRGAVDILRAATLARALRIVRSSDVHLVLLDLNLPDSGGLDTLKRMREAADCPIIVITVEDRPGLDEDALRNGAFEILHKGQLRQDSIARILRLADGHRRIQQSHEDIESRYRQLHEESSVVRARLELALAASQVCTWSYDLPSGEIVLSESWAAIIGGPPGETRTTFAALVKLLHEDDSEYLLGTLTEVAKGLRDEYAVEHRVRHKSGEWRWIISRGKVVERDARGRARRMTGTNLDISKRIQAETRLRDSEARFRALTELSSDWYWEQDENFRFTVFSESTPVTGVSATSALLGKTRWEVHHKGVTEEQWAEHRAMLAARRPFRDFEYQYVTVGGDTLWFSASGAPIVDKQGRFIGYQGVTKNVTERKRNELQLEQLAKFDMVTGLPNRALLEERLGQATVQARRRGVGSGVLFIDIDRFKLVNDTLGHQVGDELLSQFGKRLRDCVRPDDTVGRLGGDEFAVVITDLSRAEDAGIVAQKIVDAFAAPFDLQGHEVFVTASIGVAVFPGDGDDAASLLTCADMAMYRIKETSRNGFCFFSPNMNTRAASKLHMNTDLHHAVERREFELHYQPKVDLLSGVIIGMEALIRWRHPQRGLISPVEFIPALEDSGLIVPVGDWVVEEARSQLQKWHAENLKLVPIAVNLSAKQFFRRNLDRVIFELLAEKGISPQLLELEITESCLMDDPEDAARQLHALREAGFAISVDDFGTGYSSLAYLTQLPLSTLKIDRAFVSSAITDNHSAAIVRMVIDMARSLQFNVVAEGIETESQVEFLRRHGCAQGQGYFFGKPIPAAEMTLKLGR